MKYTHLAIPFALSILVSACGGGDSGAASDTPIAATTPTNSQPTQTANAPSPAVPATLLTGRFVDSAVAGLQYQTATQSGVTDANGTFTYAEGESVTFSIGDIELPAVVGADVVTPLTVFSTDDLLDLRVMNLARLLQTLDTDANPDNGIDLAEDANASATGLSVDFNSPQFETQVGNLVANSGSSSVNLVGGQMALEHLQETLLIEGLAVLPPDNPTTVDTTSNATSTHPSVGTVAEFSTFAHDVSGTMTIVDDRTIEITNFNYDGTGISVFFYNGVDGNFFQPNSQEIGQQLLRATPYVNETIVLTLPDGLTLDDFNSLSVWCVPFFASFGEATW